MLFQAYIIVYMPDYIRFYIRCPKSSQSLAPGSTWFSNEKKSSTNKSFTTYKKEINYRKVFRKVYQWRAPLSLPKLNDNKICLVRLFRCDQPYKWRDYVVFSVHCLKNFSSLLSSWKLQWKLLIFSYNWWSNLKRRFDGPLTRKSSAMSFYYIIERVRLNLVDNLKFSSKDTWG